MERSHRSLLAFVLLAVLLFAVNIFAESALRGVRLDLTEDRLFTLSEGTRNILGDLDEPVSLTLYYSDSLAEGRPAIESYARRVRELLGEFSVAAGGMLDLRIVEPTPFSDAEDRARGAGLRGVPVGDAGEQLYLGLVATNSTDGREVIPFFDPSQERFLEYELVRLIHGLQDAERPVVAVLSTLSIDGGPALPPAMRQPPQPAWRIMSELRELYDVRVIGPNVEAIEPDVDVLIVHHPKTTVNEQTRRAIDRYVLGGGSAIVFVDPLSELDIPPGAQQNPQMLMGYDRSSSMPDLLAAWGLEMSPTELVLDAAHAQRPRGGAPLLQLLQLRDEVINDDDAVTGRLSMVFVASAGALRRTGAEGLTIEPLITTSERSMVMDAGRFMFGGRPDEIAAEFAPGGEELIVAARVRGTARSAFADAAEEPASEDEGEGGDDNTGVGEINVIVVADSDLLFDALWVNEVRLGNTVLGYQTLSDNATFLLNAVENLGGSSELIGVRARGTYSRPFTEVERIRETAEQEYLREAQQLEERVREAERRITDLQRARPDQANLTLSDEQRAELESAQRDAFESRRQLRQVQFDLRRDVDVLGERLKVVNIVAAPALVLLAAIGLGAYRGARRRADRTRISAREGGVAPAPAAAEGRSAT